DLTARMLAKTPADRPRDGRAVAEELRRIEGGALPEPARAPAPRPALTSVERRVMCVVLARSSGGFASSLTESDDATLAPTELDACERALRDVASARGGRLELLADGTMLVVFRGASAATDEAERAARCALAMRAVVPAMPLCIAAGSGLASGELPAGEVVARGGELFGQAAGAGAPHQQAGAARP